MLLHFCALGVTMSWDDGFPGARASRPHNDGFLGARASRPHQAWHSLGHLPHLDQPGTAPWLCFGLADAVPADRVAACSTALKLSGGQRDRVRAGRPRSQAMPPRRCGGGGPSKPRMRRPHGAVGVSPWKRPPLPPSRVGGGNHLPPVRNAGWSSWGARAGYLEGCGRFPESLAKTKTCCQGRKSSLD